MGRSLGGGSTKAASASVGPEEVGSLGEGTDDGEGMAVAEEGEEEGCDSTIGGGIGTITEGGVGTTRGLGVGTKGGRGVGTIRGGGVGTITTGGVGTIRGGAVGTITTGGVGTITGGGVGSTAGIDGEGNGMGARPTEVNYKAALCVSARVDGLDVDGLTGGTFIR